MLKICSKYAQNIVKICSKWSILAQNMLNMLQKCSESAPKVLRKYSKSAPNMSILGSPDFGCRTLTSAIMRPSSKPRFLPSRAFTSFVFSDPFPMATPAKVPDQQHSGNEDGTIVTQKWLLVGNLFLQPRELCNDNT